MFTTKSTTLSDYTGNAGSFLKEQTDKTNFQNADMFTTKSTTLSDYTGFNAGSFLKNKQIKQTSKTQICLQPNQQLFSDYW